MCVTSISVEFWRLPYFFGTGARYCALQQVCLFKLELSGRQTCESGALKTPTLALIENPLLPTCCSPLAAEGVTGDKNAQAAAPIAAKQVRTRFYFLPKQNIKLAIQFTSEVRLLADERVCELDLVLTSQTFGNGASLCLCGSSCVSLQTTVQDIYDTGTVINVSVLRL